MTIREATLADVDRLVVMAGRFLDETPYGTLLTRSDAAIAELVRLVLTLGVGLVAEARVTGTFLKVDPGVESALVGMLGVVAVPHPLSGDLYADEIVWWVEPEFRHGSIGPRLLAAAEDWATRRGLPLLKMVAPHDSAVGTFLAHRGYAPVESAWVKRL